MKKTHDHPLEVVLHRLVLERARKILLWLHRLRQPHDSWSMKILLREFLMQRRNEFQLQKRRRLSSISGRNSQVTTGCCRNRFVTFSGSSHSRGSTQTST